MSSIDLFFFVCIFSYEIPEFQQQVMKVFQLLKDSSYWKEIDADKSFNDLQTELFKHVTETVDEARETELKKLW